MSTTTDPSRAVPTLALVPTVEVAVESLLPAVKVEAPVPAVIQRTPFDAFTATDATLKALQKIETEVTHFRHQESKMGLWGMPLVVAVPAAIAAAIFSGGLAAVGALAAGGVACGGMAALAPRFKRKIEALPVTAAKSEVPKLEDGRVRDFGDTMIADKARSILASLEKGSIKDANLIASLEALASGAPAVTDDEKTRAEAWTAIMEDRPYYQYDAVKRMQAGFAALPEDERKVLLPFVYERVRATNSSYAHGHEEFFSALRPQLPRIYPEPAQGPAPTEFDKRKLTMSAIKDTATAILGCKGPDVLSYAEIAGIAEGEKSLSDTVLASLAPLFAPERSDFERAVAGMICKGAANACFREPYEFRIALNELVRIGEAQPQDVRDEAARLLQAFDTLCEGSLLGRSRNFRGAIAMVHKLEAASTLGVEASFLR
jgi:hypothetical protein